MGQILLEAGMLTQEELELAIREHRQAGMRFGQYIVRKGILNESQIVNALCEQLGLERYDPKDYSPEKELAEMLPVDLVQKYQAVPVRNGGSLLTVAMTDPLDMDAMDRIELLSDKEVRPLICTEQEFNELLQTLFGANVGITELIKNIQPEGDDADIESDIFEDLEINDRELKGMAEDTPVVSFVDSLLSEAVRRRASDIHISPLKKGVQVRFRIDGKLHDVPAPGRKLFLPIISRIKILANMDIAVMRVPQDGRFTVNINHKEINIRASSLPTIHGENMVMRLLDTAGGIFSLEELGMYSSDRKKIEDVIKKPYGMILSTGPTGSGKTTSLYSLLKEINQPDINIITLEDPVEYRIEGIRQTRLNHKAGMTFASGIRSILRQDPDVILVGEIRDNETAAIAVQAALTGHKVLSTLHTNNAAGAITRFIDMKIAPFLISSVLLLLIAQRLVRKLCKNCKEIYTVPESILDFWEIKEYNPDSIFQPKGCHNCINTGYKDRTGVFEVLALDEMIREMILDKKSANDITLAAQKAGKLRTLKENAAGKVLQGITSFEEAGSVVMI
jgi:type IV pilus assembly protein PilB